MFIKFQPLPKNLLSQLYFLLGPVTPGNGGHDFSSSLYLWYFGLTIQETHYRWPGPYDRFSRSQEPTCAQILWDRTPWNLWSFQHIQEIVLTTEVGRGTELPWQIPEAAINLDCLEFINHQNQSTIALEEYDND